MCWPSKILRSIWLPNFFLNEIRLYIGDGRNSVAFFIVKIRLQTPKERVVSSDWSRFPTTLPPLPPNRFFLPPRFWVVTWPAATRVFLPTTKPAGSKEPGNEFCWELSLSISFVGRPSFHFRHQTGSSLDLMIDDYFRASVWYDHYGTEYMFTSRKCILLFLI